MPGVMVVVVAIPEAPRGIATRSSGIVHRLRSRRPKPSLDDSTS